MFFNKVPGVGTPHHPNIVCFSHFYVLFLFSYYLHPCRRRRRCLSHALVVAAAAAASVRKAPTVSLYDEPGPRTRRAIRLWSVVVVLALAGLVAAGLVQFGSRGQLDENN